MKHKLKDNWRQKSFWQGKSYQSFISPIWRSAECDGLHYGPKRFRKTDTLTSSVGKLTKRMSTLFASYPNPFSVSLEQLGGVAAKYSVYHNPAHYEHPEHHQLAAIKNPYRRVSYETYEFATSSTRFRTNQRTAQPLYRSVEATSEVPCKSNDSSISLLRQRYYPSFCAKDKRLAF